MSIPNVDKLTAGTVAAMRKVAEDHILPRFQKLADGDVRSKTHPGDLVTVADVESEQTLTRLLPALWPGSLVIGEEAASADARVLNLLSGQDPVWIVDPVDGTANFVNGNARFAVMVALVHQGETIMGWIHDPVENRTLWAEKGAGAWVADKGGPGVRVKVPNVGGDFSGMTAGLYNRDLAALKGKFARVVRLGSAAHDYWSLSDGRMQVLGFRRLKPWDHAAGVLIHTEAGGYNRMLTGEPYAPLPEQSGLLCAPSEDVWRKVMDLLADSEKAQP
jgi:fructose-1,6-bisphosphatase/inositol monophosphatase family enzyme